MVEQAKEVDFDLLKRQLISIYSSYVHFLDDNLSKSEIMAFRDEAYRIRLYYFNLDTLLDEDTVYALRWLIDISFDTGIKLSREDAMTILFTLLKKQSKRPVKDEPPKQIDLEKVRRDILREVIGVYHGYAKGIDVSSLALSVHMNGINALSFPKQTSCFCHITPH